MRPRRLTTSILPLVAALLAPAAARAGDGDAGASQPPPAADAKAPAAKASTPDERAAQLYAEGNAFYDQGKYKEAEAKWQAAWDLTRSFDVAGNLGNVEVMTGQPREACEHLDYALKIVPLGAPDKKKFLQKRLDEVKKQVGVLQIAVNVRDAEVMVDGRPIGKSPIEGNVYVDPGDRLIEVRYGDKTTSQTVVVARGSSQPVSLTIDTGPNMVILIAGGAAGVAGIGAGVVFAILSNGKAGDAEALPRGSPDRTGLREDQTTFGNVSFWSFVGGGAVLAGTAIYALTAGGLGGSPEAPPAGFRAVPIVTAKGGGLVIGGSF